MLPLAAALVLATAPAPPMPPPRPIVIQSLPGVLHRSCDIDPAFVRYVTPGRRAAGDKLLWLVSGAAPAADGQTIVIRSPAPHPCLTPLQHTGLGEAPAGP